MRQFIHAASGLIVNVESDEDGNYVAEVVQLPGCVAGAPTFRETMDELDGSIQAVLDVLEHDAHERYMEDTEATPPSRSELSSGIFNQTFNSSGAGGVRVATQSKAESISPQLHE